MQASEFDVTLPIGFVDDAGVHHRHAVIRKLRGHEEALLYTPGLSASQLISALIAGCTLRIGAYDPVTPELADALYTADRNYLLLEIRRVTLGDGLRATYTCPYCHTPMTVIEQLGDLEVRWLDDGARLEPIEVALADGYIDREHQHHTEVTLTLPRGEDEKVVATMLETNPAQMRDALLLRCITRFGNLPRSALEGYGIKILRELTLGDRQQLFAALNEHAPGVDFQRWVNCSHCGATYSAALDVSDFFALS